MLKKPPCGIAARGCVLFSRNFVTCAFDLCDDYLVCDVLGVGYRQLVFLEVDAPCNASDVIDYFLNASLAMLAMHSVNAEGLCILDVLQLLFLWLEGTSAATSALALEVFYGINNGNSGDQKYNSYDNKSIHFSSYNLGDADFQPASPWY